MASDVGNRATARSHVSFSSVTVKRALAAAWHHLIECISTVISQQDN